MIRWYKSINEIEPRQSLGGLGWYKQLRDSVPLAEKLSTQETYDSEGMQLGKRRSALLGSQRPRNSQPETHSDEGPGSRLLALRGSGPRNSFSDASQNSY